MPLTERDRRTLKIGGIVLGVLLLGFLVFNVLGGGGDEEDALPTVSGVPTDVEPPDDEPSITPSQTTSPVAVFTGRDPFSIPGVLSPSTSGGTTPTTPSSPPPTDGNGTTTSSPPPTDGNGSTNQGGDAIVLIDVFTVNGVERARIQVNGQVYDVAVGETFGPNGRYSLRSVSGNCATISRGDESFTLCASDDK